MVAPFLLIAAPTLGGIWVHPAAHLAIAALVLPIAAFALRSGYRKHGARWIVGLGTAAMVLVLLGAIWPLWFAGGDAVSNASGCCHECCPTVVVDDVTGERSLRMPPASVITLLGGIGLVTVHLGNLRCCAACES